MNQREEVLIRAWESFREGTGIPEAYEDHPPPDSQFYCGFTAAWNALMNELRPLVADLRSADDLDALYHAYLDAWRGEHNAAVKRLRELVRESSQ